MTMLASGKIFEISAQGGVASCVLLDATDVTPEEGARCAAQIRETLIGRVLVTRSPFRGLVFDVRKGPPVFGPKTRAELEALFARAEEHGMRIAALVATQHPVQKLQFGSLCREKAPRHGKVFEVEADASRWVAAR